MTSLLTLQDFVDYRGMSSNINFDKDLKQHVIDAQESELRVFMGESFFLALVDDFNASPSLATYTDLFDGARYTHNGKDYEYPGVKRLLVQYAHARYVAEDGTTSTPFGYRNKQHDKSDKPDPKVKGRKSAKSRSLATLFEDRMKLYLDRNSTIYPLWKCTNKKRTVAGGFKISAIG
jgi:hypothetical protein